MTFGYGFCKFACKLYQRGCGGSENGQTLGCEKYNPEPDYYLITPMELERLYRGDSEDADEVYEEVRNRG